MSKNRSLKDINIRKYYVFTRPTKVSDFREDDLYGDDDLQDKWVDKARQLQARRWRKIKHQAV